MREHLYLVQNLAFARIARNSAIITAIMREQLQTVFRLTFMMQGISGLVFHDTVDAFMEFMLNGVFGKTQAWHAVYETQGRGTLHAHMLVWFKVKAAV